MLVYVNLILVNDEGLSCFLLRLLNMV